MSDDSLSIGGKSTDTAATGSVGVRAWAGYRWRQFGTGLCFVVYGLVSWLGGITVLPVLMFWPGSEIKRERRIRALVSLSFRCLLKLIALLRVGHVHVQGREWLEQASGKLLVANHPMYLDALALVGLVPQASCVVKGAMQRNPWYRRFVRASGYISNEGSARLVDDGVAALTQGRSLILFPEGTRSTPGKPLRFYRGAAQIAIRSGCDILPVVITCEPLGLGKNQAWHEVPDRAWHLTLHICPPRPLADFDWHEGMPHGVAARHVTRAMQSFFAEQLAATGSNGEPTT